VASAEFRLAPRHPWPAFLADLRAAARWLRAHAAALGADPWRVGAIGGSTGGHLAALLALWPDDPRHPRTLALDTPDDTGAALDFAIPLWPILDVPGRYRLVTETRFGPLTRRIIAHLRRRGDPPPPSARATTARMRRLDALRARHPRCGELAADLTQRLAAIAGELPLSRALLYAALAHAHDGAFRDRAEMEAASPLHLLRRGAARCLPPLLIVQGTRDTNTTAAMSEAFAAEYRARGGQVELALVPGLGHSYGNVPSRAADELVERVDAFIRRPAARAASAEPAPRSAARPA
jgi:acetyl esterase/lipase